MSGGRARAGGCPARRAYTWRRWAGVAIAAQRRGSPAPGHESYEGLGRRLIIVEIVDAIAAPTHVAREVSRGRVHGRQLINLHRALDNKAAVRLRVPLTGELTRALWLIVELDERISLTQLVKLAFW